MKNYLVLIALIFCSFTGLAQAHFTSAHSGSNAEAYMTVWVYSARIGAANLQAGDEIAVFDGAVCVGVKTLAAELTSAVSVKVAKTDAGLSNGYVAGHSITTVKIWDSSAAKEYIATVAFRSDSPYTVFTDNESGYVNLTVVEALTITLTAQNKQYDGTDAATTGYTVGDGTISGNVTVDISNAKFSSKNVGTGKTVTADMSVSGSDAANYSFTFVKTATANITAKVLSVTGVSVQNKIYDGTTTAQLIGAVLSGVVNGDIVNLSNGSAGTFAQTNVGNEIAVNTAMSLTGTDVGNYSLNQPTGLKANITVRATTIKPDARSKSYGSTDPVLTYQAVPAIVSGESFTGALSRTSGESVGTYDYTLGNLTSGSNYSLTLDSSVKFQITKTTLKLSGLSVATKVYDGNTNATLTGTPSLNGVIGSESVTLTGTPVASFSTASAGNGIVVNISGLSLTGTNSGNYSLDSSVNGNITRKEVTVDGATAQNKAYDGSIIASISGSVLTGKINGDDVNLVTPVIGYFSQKLVGTGIDVSASTMSLTGAAASNYTLVYPTGLKADITKKDLTITANSKSKCYGSALSLLGNEFNTNGLIAGDVVSTVLLSCNGIVTGAALGTYDIVPSAASGSGLSNYSLVYINGKLSVDPLPVPSISGSASVTQAPVTVTYTTDSGMRDYSWSVTPGGKITSGSGTKSVVVNWTDISNQSITVSYTNAGGCLGTVTKSITLFPLPTAVLSGSIAICPETATKLNVVLTGTAPWKITYSDGTTSQTITNIAASPFTIEVMPPAGKTTTYTVTEVSDGNNMSNKGTGVAVISVNPTIEAPTVGNVGTICYASETLVSATVPSGQPGLTKYQWQNSDDNITWKNIPEATSLVYPTGPLYNSVYYRILASIANCTEKVSNVTKIVVNEPLTNAVISADQQTVCYGEIPSRLTATSSSGGNGKFSYQWQVKISGLWTNIGTNSLSYQPESLTATTSFRLITRDIGSPSCGSVYSNEFVITVKSQVKAGILSGDQKIVNGVKPAAISSVIAGSGDGLITYKWESSIDGGLTWNQITGETGLGYAPGAILQPSWFRRITFSTLNGVTCSSATNPVKIAMWPTTIDPYNNVENELKVFSIRNVEIRIWGLIKTRSVARLFDMQGREVINQELETGDSNTIKLPPIRNGVYILTIKGRNQTQRFKMFLSE